MNDKKLEIINFFQARYGMMYLSAYDFITDNPKTSRMIYNRFKGRQEKIDNTLEKLKNKLIK